MEIDQLIAALAPSDVLGRAPVEIAELAYDARAAGAGSLFFCVPGARVDGHEFAADAIANGAVALVVERPLELDVPQLVVPSTRAAMAVAADEFFGRPTEELQVAGVTGTNGKTTTAFLLYAILAAAGRRPGLLGTIESRVGGERRPAVRTTPDLDGNTIRERVPLNPEAKRIAAGQYSRELHPAQLYSAFNSFLITAMLVAFFSMRPPPGRVMALMLVLEGTTRFLLELVRAEPPVLGPMSISMVIAIFVVIAGIVMWIAFGDRADEPAGVPVAA